jgi:hypothetical protein
VTQLRQHLNSSFRNSSFLLMMSLLLQLPAYQIQVGQLGWPIVISTKQSKRFNQSLLLIKTYTQGLGKLRCMSGDGQYKDQSYLFIP